jgi:hypothetical protein
MSLTRAPLRTTPGPHRRLTRLEWGALPDAQLLEVCAFLDPQSLARLEVCGGLDTATRALAWKGSANTVPRGALMAMSDKDLVAAHVRTRLLFPDNMHEAGNPMDYHKPREYRDEESPLDGFAFTWALFWHDFKSNAFRTAAFENMSMKPLGCGPRGEMELIGSHLCKISDTAEGHATIAPLLLESQEYARRDAGDEFVDKWYPCAHLYCVRKRDGAVIKVAACEGIDSDINSMSRESGTICFDPGVLLLDDDDSRNGSTSICLVLVFDKATGRMLACVSSNLDENQLRLDDNIFRALLHAKFEDSSSFTGKSRLAAPYRARARE